MILKELFSKNYESHTYEKLFWKNDIRKITNLMRNSLKK